MDKKTNRICIICARGGSKRLPGKNIKNLNGFPLISYTIKSALNSKSCDDVVVSSDCEEILSVSSKFGANLLIKRPDHLATDEASSLDAIEHAVVESEKNFQKKYRTIVFLEATTPFRKPEDIINSIELFEKSDASNLFTVCRAKESPYSSIVEVSENERVVLSKKPDLDDKKPKACFVINGAVYIWKRDVFFKKKSLFYDDTKIYEMPIERSLDIDTEFDLKLASCYIKNL